MERLEEEWWIVCRLCGRMSRPNSRQWLHACQCPQPYHRQCLQYYVWKCESKRPPQAPVCLWCEAIYRVHPTTGIATMALEKIAYNWYPKTCDVVAAITYQVVVDSASATFGFIIVSSVYGFDEALVLMMDMDPLVAFIILQSLPLIAIIINYVPWEDHFLICLRKCNRLPVLGAMMPQGGPELLPLKRRSMKTWQAVMGGLFLPFFANTTGHFLFSSEQSPVKRFLYGGVFFLVVRGFVYMYYQQKKCIRQFNLAVVNYMSSATDGNE